MKSWTAACFALAAAGLAGAAGVKEAAELTSLAGAAHAGPARPASSAPQGATVRRTPDQPGRPQQHAAAAEPPPPPPPKEVRGGEKPKEAAARAPPPKAREREGDKGREPRALPPPKAREKELLASLEKTKERERDRAKEAARMVAVAVGAAAHAARAAALRRCSGAEARADGRAVTVSVAPWREGSSLLVEAPDSVRRAVEQRDASSVASASASTAFAAEGASSPSLSGGTNRTAGSAPPRSHGAAHGAAVPLSVPLTPRVRAVTSLAGGASLLFTLCVGGPFGDGAARLPNSLAVLHYNGGRSSAGVAGLPTGPRRVAAPLSSLGRSSSGSRTHTPSSPRDASPLPIGLAAPSPPPPPPPPRRRSH